MAGARSFGGEATARPMDFPAFAGRALDTTSPYVHATSAPSGFQRANFLKAFRLSPERGSVANAVAWNSRSSSMKMYWRIPLGPHAAAAWRSAASSGTEHTTSEEMSVRFPKRMPASWAAWAAWMSCCAGVRSLRTTM